MRVSRAFGHSDQKPKQVTKDQEASVSWKWKGILKAQIAGILRKDLGFNQKCWSSTKVLSNYQKTNEASESWDGICEDLGIGQ